MAFERASLKDNIQLDRWKKTQWLPLSGAFAALLILILVLGLTTFRETFDIFRRMTEAYDRYNRAGSALMNIRSDIYLAGILKRDFLSEPDAETSDLYRDQFTKVQKSTEGHLDVLAKVLDAEQTSHLKELREQVLSYLKPFDRVQDWELPQPASVRWRLLRQQLSQRDTALALASDLESLAANSFARRQEQIRSAESAFRLFLQWITAITLVLGAAVAVSSTIRILRLEKKSKQAEKQLRQLSNQLVKVQEEERKSISRELHDEVGQLLTGLRMELASLDGPLSRSNPAFHQRLSDARSIAEQTLRSVRNLAMVLRPSMLDDTGLAPALDWQVGEFSRHSGIRVELQLRGELDQLPDEYRTCLYRVVQEALTNVARHANAKLVRVTISSSYSTVSAEIEDEGSGFDPKKLERPGLGLVGMQERARELGGSLNVSTIPGKGTRISMRLPVKVKADEHTSIVSG